MALDDSGSMSFTIGVPTVIESVDEYLRGVREDSADDAGDTLVTIDAINRGLQCVAQPINDVPSIGTWYRAGGGTPLFDGIARSLVATDEKLVEIGNPTMKVLHVTVSDGGENQSVEYPNENRYGPPANRALARMIQEYENLTYDERTTLPLDVKAEILAQRIADDDAQGNWTFVYLGNEASQQDAAVASAGIGYRSANSMAYMATPEGADRTMGNLRAATLSRKASAQAATSSFFTDAGQSEADYLAKPGGSDDPLKPRAAQPGDVADATGVKLSERKLGDYLGGSGS